MIRLSEGDFVSALGEVDPPDRGTRQRTYAGSIRGEEIGLNRHLTDYVHRGLMFSLGRFSERIRRVKVTIADVNGPRGGDDKRCRICVDMGALGIVVAEDTDAVAAAAINNAAERTGRAVKRRIECVIDRKRRAPSYGGCDYVGTASE